MPASGEAMEFSLTSHTGAPFALHQVRGKVVLVFFGFTHCPDICSPTLARLAAAMGELGERRDQVRVLFVTVDPERDTPAQMGEFLARFGPGFVGLTGTAAQLQAVAAQFRVGAVSGPDGAIAHSGAVFALDREARMRLMFREDLRPAQIAADLGRLLDAG